MFIIVRNFLWMLHESTQLIIDFHSTFAFYLIVVGMSGRCMSSICFVAPEELETHTELDE